MQHAVQHGIRMAARRLLGEIMTASETSLYRRLGGYDVIAAVIDDMFAILFEDPTFARFAGGRSVSTPVVT
jgi:hemoglobin